MIFVRKSARFLKKSVAGAGLLAMLAFYAAQPVHATAFNDPGARGGAANTPTGDLVPDRPTVEGGEVSIGATAQIVVLFRNDSGRPITTGPIQLYPSSTVSANVALNQCAMEPLPAGAVCAVSVQVKGLSDGNWRVEMLMRHSGRSRMVTSTISGRVSASDKERDRFISDIEAIPTELDFESITTSQSMVRGVVFRNITSDPIDINAIYIEAAQQSGYSLRTDCAQLQPGQACIVTVNWSPLLEGEASGVLMVEHSGPTSVASVRLSGEYTPGETARAQTFPKAVPGMGLLVSSQDSVDFGTGIATTSAITVSLVNVGDAPLNLKNVSLANGDNGLSIAKSGCAPGMVLEPVQACPLTISWSPVREGSIIDDVQIAHDGTRGVLVLPVRGAAATVVSQDSKAVRLSNVVTSIVGGETSDGGTAQEQITLMRDDSVDPASVLDGFSVTSHAGTRAIITGPGGSRIVFDGEDVVVGGFLWQVRVRGSGVEFQSGQDKVLLLFDRSLSSVNRGSGQSGSGAGGSASSSASGVPSSTN